MNRQLLLYGFNSEQSLIVLWKMLFSPYLLEQFGADKSLQWCEQLVDIYNRQNDVQFSTAYNQMASEVGLKGLAKPSIKQPPWAMISLDMQIGAIPWITPIFDRFLLALFSNGGKAIENYFGSVLPLAFISGGPGDTPDTALRVCAPCGPVRASTEHWIMRAYLWRREYRMHASLAPDQDGRTFSMHRYIDQDGRDKSIYFDTTESFGREEDDFLEFVFRKPAKKFTESIQSKARFN